MFNLELQWKPFKVNLDAVKDLAQSLDSNCVGTSADSNLKIHFLVEPSQEVKDQLLEYWEELTEESEEVISYRSKDQVDAATAVKRESAKAKLAALGLDADEIAALLG